MTLPYPPFAEHAMKDSMPEFLTPKEAAEILKVHYQTVYELCANGSLKHIKVGRQIRIKPEDLDRIEQPTSRATHW